MRARTRENEGLNQCLNDGGEITKARMLLLSYDRQIEEGISFKRLEFASCTLQYWWRLKKKLHFLVDFSRFAPISTPI